MEKIMIRKFFTFIFCLLITYFSSAIADINDTEKKQGQSFENLDNEITFDGLFPFEHNSHCSGLTFS